MSPLRMVLPTPHSGERTLAINDSPGVMSEGWGQPGSPGEAGQGPGAAGGEPGPEFCAVLCTQAPPCRGRAEQPGQLLLRAQAVSRGVSAPESAAAAPPSGPGRAVPPRPLLAALGPSPGKPQPAPGRQDWTFLTREGGSIAAEPEAKGHMCAPYILRKGPPCLQPGGKM